MADLKLHQPNEVDLTKEDDEQIQIKKRVDEERLVFLKGLNERYFKLFENETEEEYKDHWRTILQDMDKELEELKLNE